MPLPARQQQVYDFFRGYQSNHGMAPTIAQVRDGCGFKTHVVAVNAIKALQRKGYLVRPRRESTGDIDVPALHDDTEDELGAFFVSWQEADMLLDMVADGLQAGLVPMDAVKRAHDAQGWLKSHFRTNRPDPQTQRIVRILCRAAMRSRGAERGVTLAGRAVEAARLMQEMV